ncbi:MAG: hypothetical protein WAM73_09680 [Desulfobacterales bacterium]
MGKLFSSEPLASVDDLLAVDRIDGGRLYQAILNLSTVEIEIEKISGRHGIEKTPDRAGKSEPVHEVF